MLFTSYEFLLFAALLLVGYYLFPRAWQWRLLLVASLVFYWLAGPRYLIFLLLTASSTYAVGRWMDANLRAQETTLTEQRQAWEKEQRKSFKAREKKKRFRMLLLGLIFNFGMLAVLKYTGFAVHNVNRLLHAFGAENTLNIPSLLLPMGISFYTFQSMSYLIDVYREKVSAERHPLKFLLFVSYFPQLVQGPISRYADLGPQLTAGHAFSSRNVRWGLERVLWGYFKKLVIADRALIVIKALLDEPASYRGMYVLMMILLYTVQIYADFTGGIDITVGLSEAMGIRLTENFNRPFLSRSTKEYWNRWHITMGTWFTDYVFYPLSVCKPMQRLSKFSRQHFGNAVGKRIPVYLATVATWFLTGLWHGAGWNFIVWGLLNCLVILVSQECVPLYTRFYRRFPRLNESAVWHGVQAARTVLLMGVIRTLDCYRDVPLTFRLWGSMFTTFNYGDLFNGAVLDLGLGRADWILLLIATAVMFAVSLWGIREPVRAKLDRHPTAEASAVALVFLLIMIFGAYGIGFDASQFIYNQF
ncbi:MAG: MBOAT family protein [Clostridia bacterium]|nr:MBOAT family protein [Clostridia bacterium]